VHGSPDGAYGRRSAVVPRDCQLGFEYWKGFECCHEYWDSPYFVGDDPTERRWEGYDALAQSRDAADYIRAHASGDSPFLLMLSWGPPHFPLHTAPEEHRRRYEGRAISLRPNVPPALRARAERELRGYYAHIAALDEAFGLVREAVREAGIDDRTIVVFASDHGEMRWSQGVETKLVPWDESVRVPFLLRDPRLGGSAPAASPVPIDAPDIMPTLLGLCGMPVPASVEGVDWSPFVRGERASSGDEAALLVMPAAFAEMRQNGMEPYRGLRTARHTYVRTVDGPWLLYDNARDPFQMENLVDSPAHAELRQRLDAALAARLARTGDRFLDSASYLKRFGLEHYREARAALVRPWRDPWH